jgi:hypothetical protein
MITRKRKGIFLIIIGIILCAIFITEWYKDSRSVINSITIRTHKCIAILEPLFERGMIKDNEYKYLKTQMALHVMHIKMLMRAIAGMMLLLCIMLVGYGGMLFYQKDTITHM